YYERALKRGDLPSALRERAVPLRFWRDGEDCWLQPAAWLESETSYALAFRGLGTLRVVRAETGLEPRARRLFPPPGSAKHGVAARSRATNRAPTAWLSAVRPRRIERHRNERHDG